ncbi:MAG: hypothetical protein Q9M94_01690 [Candidatus Gracilibacteria bacterium]|nr:hypothetical protein [Candidatus Gracilibacteria bacterium]MDQ7023459.1 hypothetical protein [Candidatus Gracilibacteria bacterium]
MGKFDGIISSINIFSEINSTGIINKEKIGNPGNLVGPEILEKKLLQLGILGENGGFSQERSKEILSKGKVSD